MPEITITLDLEKAYRLKKAIDDAMADYHDDEDEWVPVNLHAIYEFGHTLEHEIKRAVTGDLDEREIFERFKAGERLSEEEIAYLIHHGYL